MKTKLLLIFLLILTCDFLPAQTCNNKIGVNLDGIGGIAFEFSDVMKTAGKPKKFPSPASNALTDANNWPLEDCQITFFDHRPFGAWAPPADDPALYVVDLSGVYTLTFTGQATISSWCDAPISNTELTTGKIYNAATNTTTVSITWPSSTSSGGWKYGYFVLNFTNTKATPSSPANSGIKNIRMIRPGYSSSTAQVFRKEFLDAISIFSCIRFMDWTHTNNNGPSSWSASNYTTWNDRQKPDVFPYSNGAPWEAVMDLINLTGKDIWINIPQAANDDYVTQLATLMKDRLRSDVNIYLEYSNEVWNGSFNQYDYNYSAVLNSPDDADIRTSTSFDDRRRARRAAKRVIRIGQIFKNVFGVTLASRTRIRPVFAWQIGGWLPWYEDVLNWINSTYGAPKNYIYGIASAPYFNDSGFGSTETPQQIVARMSANSDANLTAIKTLAQYAASWNILHLQYEGGPDNGGGNAINIGNRITANRIPEMKTAVIHNYQDNWFSAAANGTAPLGTNDLVNYFVMSGKVSRYGCWGATEDLAYLNDLSKAPKYDALCVLSGKCANPPSVSITSPSNNAILNAGTSYTISTNASASAAISRVEYFAGSEYLGSDNSSPYSFSWTPATPGSYSIYAKVLDSDCKYRFAQPLEVIVSATLGLGSQEVMRGMDFVIFPNPADKAASVKISMNNPLENYSLQIINSIGETIKTIPLEQGQADFKVGELPAGVYTVIIRNSLNYYQSKSFAVFH